ncbi:MAG: copper-binding protein [Candidatus Omnitrophica bacterium]|nr:copper-binding protein [Candidatus Omnitrophota bacterium]
MKRFIAALTGLIFILSTCVSIYAVAENPKQNYTKEKVKPDIQHIYGEITILDLENNKVTIKAEDGTELTLKATTEKTQGMLNDLKVGDKVKALYLKSGEDLIIFKVIKPEAKGKEKPKKK